MQTEVKNIAERALKLPSTSRAYLAEVLLQSLDYEEDFPVSDAWIKEILSVNFPVIARVDHIGLVAGPSLLRCSYNHLIFMNLIFPVGTILDEISP